MVDSLNPIRKEVYKKNKLLTVFNGLCNDNIPQAKISAVLNTLSGYELAILKAKELKKKGYEVTMEVDIGSTKIDILATKGKEKLLIEAKSGNKLKRKVLWQIGKYKGHYKDAKVLVAVSKDTSTRDNLAKRIKEAGAEIEVVDVTKEELTRMVFDSIKRVKIINALKITREIRKPVKSAVRIFANV